MSRQASLPTDPPPRRARRAVPCHAVPYPRFATPCRATPNRRAIHCAPASLPPRTTNHDASRLFLPTSPPPPHSRPRCRRARPRRAKLAAYSRQQLPFTASQSATVARCASTRGRYHSQIARVACILLTLTVSSIFRA